MSIDLREIANQITDDTPQGAAVTTARLINALLESLPRPRSRSEFIAALQMEMARIGYRLEPAPNLGAFYRLKVGDHFKTLDGRRYRRIEPVADYDPRDGVTILLEAYDLEHGCPVYLPGNEAVEKTEPL